MEKSFTAYTSLPPRLATQRNEQALQRGWEQVMKNKPLHRRKGAEHGGATIASYHAAAESHLPHSQEKRKKASKPTHYKSTAHPLQRLENLEDELRSHHGNTGANRWMVPYADLMTLLLGMFLVLMALATQHQEFLEGVTDTLMKDLKTEQARVVAQEAELNQLRETLQEELHLTEPVDVTADIHAKNLMDKDIKVRQDERGLVITLLDSVLFTPGSAELSTEAKATLSKLATQLKPLPNEIRVEGHTDDTPIHTSEFPNNWYLSTTRATQIVEYLIQAHRFAPQRLSAAGYGQYHPVAKNSSIEGKRQNRRVDIIVLNPQHPAQTSASATQLPNEPASASQ